MKHWFKILTLSFFCLITTVIFISCGPNISASNADNLASNHKIQDNTVISDINDSQPEIDEPVAETNHQNFEDSEQLEEICHEENDEIPTLTNVHQHRCEWRIIKSATCSEPGLEAYVCITCGEHVDTRDIALIQHHYIGTISKPATCCSDGEEIFTCKYCQHTYTQIIPAAGEHEYEIIETMLPTCEHEGYHQYKCKHGDATYTETIPTLEHEIDPQTHRCEYCKKLLIKSPLNDLANSYWYLEKNLTIYFESYNPTDKTGTYSSYRITINEDDTITKNKQQPFKGTYTVNENSISFTDTYCLHEDKNNEYEIPTFTLNYQEKQNDDGETLHTLNGTPFSKSKYANSTLIFVGYEL